MQASANLLNGSVSLNDHTLIAIVMFYAKTPRIGLRSWVPTPCFMLGSAALVYKPDYKQDPDFKPK